MPDAGVKVNGQDIKVETELHHNDRYIKMINKLIYISQSDASDTLVTVSLCGFAEPRVKVYTHQPERELKRCHIK